MKIEVIGTGCATCKQLYELTQRAVQQIDGETTLEYIAETAGMKRLMELGLMRSPAITRALYFCANSTILSSLAISPSIEKTPSVTIILKR
jgi:hypothetical protein